MHHEERRLVEPTTCAFGTFSAEMVLGGEFDPEHLRRMADRTYLLMGASLYIGLLRLGVADQRWSKGSRQATIPFKGESAESFSVDLTIPLDLNLDIPYEPLRSFITGNVVAPVIHSIGYSIDERDHLVGLPEATLTAMLGDTSRIDRALEQFAPEVPAEADSRTRSRSAQKQ